MCALGKPSSKFPKGKIFDLKKFVEFLFALETAILVMNLGRRKNFKSGREGGRFQSNFFFFSKIGDGATSMS